MQITSPNKADKNQNQHPNVTYLEDREVITRNNSEVDVTNAIIITYNCKHTTKNENNTTSSEKRSIDNITLAWASENPSTVYKQNIESFLRFVISLKI